MDLLATLASKIDRLSEGDYIAGLRAVLAHIEAAYGHLTRGQREDSDSAFTDVIYRCNQAFEGSIKEAYRVLAGRDPKEETPYKIEKYLENNNVFRERVLAQFTNCRTEWRNPSTHDYKLDFDESESFLAIVSVSAFACVLIDQISRELAFKLSAEETDAKKTEIEQQIKLDSDSDLLETAVGLFIEFSRLHADAGSIETEMQLMGALTGFFSALVPEMNATLDYKLSAESHDRGDLLLSLDEEQVLVELKRSTSPRHVEEGIFQLTRYMSLAGVKAAILFAFPPHGGELRREEHAVPEVGGRIVVLRADKGV